MVDRDGWHFINNKKYTVKSGYQVKRIYPDQPKLQVMYGPYSGYIKSIMLESKVPIKNETFFLWQIISGCIAVRKNLQTKGIQRDICCERYGATEESIHHVFFECPLALQVWELSKIPLGALKDPIKFNNLSNGVVIRKHGSSFLESSAANG